MIVSNTTPISNFLHIGRIDVFHSMFDKIHIPPAVKQEIEAGFSDNMTWRKCLNDGFFMIQEVKNQWISDQLIEKLHAGEAEALCVCMENNSKLCLLDDKDAREIAVKNNIPVTGTLGILIQAKKRNQIESVKHYMDELKNHHHFWISNAIYLKILRLSGEDMA